MRGESVSAHRGDSKRWMLRLGRPVSVALAALLLASPAGAQDAGPASVPGALDSPGAGEGEAQERIPPVNVVKLLAQRAALPFLRGDERFVLRESWWNGRIGPGEAKLIQVQLFSRNAYQFWLAVPNREAVVDLNLYDSEGQLVEVESPEIEGGNIVSILAHPERSGLYYLRIALREGIEQDQEWGVIYAYR